MNRKTNGIHYNNNNNNNNIIIIIIIIIILIIETLDYSPHCLLPPAWPVFLLISKS
jgi:hypothetical protein